MNNSKIRIAIMIVPLLLFVATIGIIISMNEIDKQTEETTTLYTATVRDIEIGGAGEKRYVQIHTGEYDTALHVSTNIIKNIKISDISDLKKGQPVWFRIENIGVKQIDGVEFINIVSLKTETKEIFSLDEYNEFIHNSAYPARMAGLVTALLFLFLSLFIYLKFVRKVRTGQSETS